MVYIDGRVVGARRLATSVRPAIPTDSFKMKTILLLVASNIFMTLAWYGHLKFKFLEGKSLAFVILVSWGIAFFEYCLMVPANRLGYLSGAFTGYQLKIIQEAITLLVFVVFAWLVLKERLTWNYAVSFVLILLAVFFATAFKSGGGAPGGH
jgi:uncharacterized protein